MCFTNKFWIVELENGDPAFAVLEMLPGPSLCESWGKACSAHPILSHSQVCGRVTSTKSALKVRHGCTPSASPLALPRGLVCRRQCCWSFPTWTLSAVNNGGLPLWHLFCLTFGWIYRVSLHLWKQQSERWAWQPVSPRSSLIQSHSLYIYKKLPGMS